MFFSGNIPRETKPVETGMKRLSLLLNRSVHFSFSKHSHELTILYGLLFMAARGGAMKFRFYHNCLESTSQERMEGDGEDAM